MNPVEALDRYLLQGDAGKAALVAELLAQRPGGAPAQPFYRALETLGESVPDDALIALRIALAGRQPGDEEVLALREIVRESRAGGEQAAARLRERYAEIVSP